jgi:hypothetical protein
MSNGGCGQKLDNCQSLGDTLVTRSAICRDTVTHSLRSCELNQKNLPTPGEKLPFEAGNLMVWAKTHREPAVVAGYYLEESALMWFTESVNHIGLCDVAVFSVMWHLSESALMCFTISVNHIGIW